MEKQYFKPGPIKLARAYVPVQHYTDKFSLSEALEKGTLFPELWKPYERQRR